MAARQGSLSINSENIFPIIKKWLYSDHDIFYRELISNGCDAITKLRKLDMMGEFALADGFKGQIKEFTVNPEAFLSKGKATPFTGWKLNGECLLTVCDGKAVYKMEE